MKNRYFFFLLREQVLFVDINIQLIKRKRGRPANKDTSDKKKQKVIDPSIPKRGRGRPKKVIPV